MAKTIDRPRVSAFPKCWLDALSTGGMDLFDWIRISVSLGAEGLEMYDRFFPPGDAAFRRRVREAVEKTGRTCPMLCVSPDFTVPDPAARAAQVEGQKRAIDLAADLGVRWCRVLSGQRRPDVPVEDGIRWVVECIRQVLPYAESKGIVLAMENHYKDGFWQFPEFAQKADVFHRIVESIDSPWFGVQYDPSNAVVAGDDPVALLGRVKHRVVTMHASDRYLDPGTTLEDMKQADGTLGYPKNLHHGVVGRGLNDYDAIFRILREAGYAGWISIEDGVNGMEEMKESVDFLKAKIAQYWR
jgi:sugar phosphate isomerase/epimerase